MPQAPKEMGSAGRSVWVFLGYPANANPDGVFEIENFDNPDRSHTVRGVLPIASNHRWCQHCNTDPNHTTISDKMDALHTPNIDVALDLGAYIFRLKLQCLIDEETTQ